MNVYYNGSCTICNTEIGHYKKKTHGIKYIDVSCFKDEHVAHLSKKDLYRRMHVYFNGELYSGSESFLILWSKMSNFIWLSKFLGLPILKQIWFIGYECLAFILFVKNFYLKKII
jgi:predicted DCC family thiol-disulfide oxidoreductase YuxK|tara:strand:+ start:388 stop:732 length:345 start_codon:yes stop_codon:yes gene_type:complete